MIWGNCKLFASKAMFYFYLLAVPRRPAEQRKNNKDIDFSLCWGNQATIRSLYKQFWLHYFSIFNSLLIGIYLLRMRRPKNPKPNRACPIQYIPRTRWYILWFIYDVKSNAFTYEYYSGLGVTHKVVKSLARPR